MKRLVPASALVFTVLAASSCRRSQPEANNPPNRDQGLPPVAAPCSQPTSFCVGVAPGGSMWVAAASGHWSPVRPTELRDQATAFVAAHATGSHGYIVYWANTHQPNSVEASLRNAGMQAIDFLPATP